MYAALSLCTLFKVKDIIRTPSFFCATVIRYCDTYIKWLIEQRNIYFCYYAGRIDAIILPQFIIEIYTGVEHY